MLITGEQRRHGLPATSRCHVLKREIFPLSRPFSPVGVPESAIELLETGSLLGLPEQLLASAVIKLSDRTVKASPSVICGVGLAAIALYDFLGEEQGLGLISAAAESMSLVDAGKDSNVHSTMVALARLSLKELPDPPGVAVLAEWFTKERRRSIFTEIELAELAQGFVGSRSRELASSTVSW